MEPLDSGRNFLKQLRIKPDKESLIDILSPLSLIQNDQNLADAIINQICVTLDEARLKKIATDKMIKQYGLDKLLTNPHLTGAELIAWINNNPIALNNLARGFL